MPDTPPPTAPTAGDWIRYALTGAFDADAPADADLAPLIADATAEIQQAHPQTENLTGAGDQAVFAKAVAYKVVADFLGSSAGVAYAGNTIKVDIDLVSETRAQVGATDSVSLALAQYQRALLRISTLRLTAPPPPSLFRTVGTPHATYWGNRGYGRGCR